MKSLKYLLATLLILTCFLNSGCDLTLGPKVKTNWVILHPGKPGQILRNKTLLMNVYKGTKNPVQQDVGGWIVMPPEHWDAVQRALKKAGDI